MTTDEMCEIVKGYTEIRKLANEVESMIYFGARNTMRDHMLKTAATMEEELIARIHREGLTGE